MTASLAFLIAGSLLLYGGGEALVRGAGNLALRLGISPFIVGMTVVAFATSAPELAVSLRAALVGLDDVAVGNVVGSNIANIGLILGASALLAPAVVRMRLLRLDLPWLIVVSAMLVVFLYDGLLTRVAGVFFLCGLMVFVSCNVIMAQRDQEAEDVRREFEHVLPKRNGHGIDLLLILAGLAALITGAAAFVRGGVALAEALGIEPAVIALTVVAVGTSLPELATSLVAAFRGDADIAVGNVVGSNFFNILAILGITATINPLARGGVTRVDLMVMLLFALALLPLLWWRRRIGRPEGLVLLTGYAGYIGWLVSAV